MITAKKGKSLLTKYMDYCLICGKPRKATHHLLSGIGCRKLSDSDRVIMPLCYEHHVGKNGIHTIREIEVLGKIIGQLAWEKNYILNLYVNEHPGNSKQKGELYEEIADKSREAFRERYGKSLL